MKVTARELVRNVVKEKLARDEVALSMTVRLVRTAEIVTIAKTAGFDTFYIDLEHSTLSMETTSQICISAMNAGITSDARFGRRTNGAMPAFIAEIQIWLVVSIDSVLCSGQCKTYRTRSFGNRYDLSRSDQSNRHGERHFIARQFLLDDVSN